MRSTRALSLALAVIVVAALRARAQTGVFRGVVTSDTLGHPASRAEVAIPELQRTALVDERGEFRFSDVPAGHYAVVVRAIGFQLFTTPIDVAAGGTVDAELTLLPAAVQLDSVRTTASLTPPVPRQLEEFEFRQRAQISGYFLSDSMLRRRDRDNLAQVIRMLPGVTEYMGHLGSTRGGAVSGPMFRAHGGCFFTVFLDGAKIYQYASGSGVAPDFSKLQVEDFYGVEVYLSSASLPEQYNSTGPGCGAILLWTRPGHHP